VAKVEALSPTASLSIAILLLALTVDLWVYNDAGKRQQHGLAPSVSIGSVRVETPQVWFLGCVLLCADQAGRPE
jgi:hypothetical protein